LLIYSYLWYFVSKFTVYNAKKLFKLYKQTLKKEAKKKDKSQKAEKSVMPN
jgi:hypothetical protein